MVVIRLFVFFIAVAWLSNFLGPAYSQTQQTGDKQSPLKWVSHQMNQTERDMKQKGKISPKMVEEIQKLYLLAKKELEEQGSKRKAHPMPVKAATSHGRSKQMVNPAK
jgi:hypothetical protein